MSELRADLENLIKSPGWQWLKQQELDRWRDQLPAFMEQAASDTDDKIAVQKIRQVSVAFKAVQQVFARPEVEIMKLQSTPTEATFSRRGGL